MASMQQSSIPEKHREVINKMKAASRMKLKDEGGKGHTCTRGLVHNFCPGGTAVFHDNYDWSGKSSSIDCHPPIEEDKSLSFDHYGTKKPAGSKGAVVYAGKTDPSLGNNDIAWLMAWQSPLDGTYTNKVYVECGDINNYQDIKWDDIEKKLDASNTNECNCHDEDTGADVTGHIDATGVDPRVAFIIDVKNYC